MDTFLQLGPLEQEYWSSPSTHNSLRIVDTLGLILGVSSAIGICIQAWGRDFPCIPSIIGMIMQMAQLIWLLCYNNSYMRVRLSLMLVQRVRWMVVVFILYSMPTSRLYGLSKFTRMASASGHTGSIEAFGTVLLTQPILALLACANHPLPFKHQAAMSVITIIFYTKHMHHHQVTAVEIFQLQGWVEPTCRQLQAALLAPLPGNLATPTHICSCTGTTSFVMMYVFVLIAVILPLHLHYWHENASKAAWLKARGVPGLQALPVPAIIWVAYAWAQSMIAWVVLAIYAAVSSHH
jgi:hypothetical protein